MNTILIKLCILLMCKVNIGVKDCNALYPCEYKLGSLTNTSTAYVLIQGWPFKASASVNTVTLTSVIRSAFDSSHSKH